MGQYFITVNLDKKQYLDPHKFGSGLKLGEFSSAKQGLPSALCLLLATDSSESPWLGSWAGDRIVVAGDYGTPKYGVVMSEDDTLYTHAREHFADISNAVIDEIKACFAWHDLHTLDMTNDGWRQHTRKTKDE